MAYNEEANIGPAVASILSQALRTGTIEELIVVASGCEDRTAEIVTEASRTDPRVRLIEQSCREGKASAINLFIAAAAIAGSHNGERRCPPQAGSARSGSPPLRGSNRRDGRWPPHTCQRRVDATRPRRTPSVLHDQIARQSPKLGEMVAFRNVVPGIPLDTAVDEISIQAIVTQLGYLATIESTITRYGELCLGASPGWNALRAA
jgi:hypothetical protein